MSERVRASISCQRGGLRSANPPYELTPWEERAVTFEPPAGALSGASANGGGVAAHHHKVIRVRAGQAL